jgi:hypothetical protein
LHGLVARLGQPRLMILAETYPAVPDRPCQFQLSLQRDSVFADFDKDPDGCLYLVRISYDSYGCVEVERHEVSRMSLVDSERMIEMYERGHFDVVDTNRILGGYLHANRAALYEEALRHHQLIDR